MRTRDGMVATRRSIVAIRRSMAATRRSMAATRRSVIATVARGAAGRFAGVLASAALAALAALSGCDSGPAVESPRLLSDADAIVYPLEMWEQDAEGIAVVIALINEHGTVDSVRIVESSGHELLDSTAVRGAREMEFAPAVRDGEPVAVWTRLPVHFSKSADPEGASETTGAGSVDGSVDRSAHPGGIPAPDSASRP